MKIKRSSRTGAEKKLRWMNAARKTLSLVLLLLSAIPMLGGGVKGLWVIPAAVCICMQESMYFCMLMGVISGILIDLACDSALCANAIFMVCFCTAASLLFSQLLRHSVLHYLFMTAVCTFLRAGASYLFTAVLFRTESRSVLWSAILLPSAYRTMLAAIPVYLLFLLLTKLRTGRVRSMDAAAVRRDW